MKKIISVVTSSRADYGLLKPLLIKLEKSNQFRLKLLVTGSHLLKNYGYTFKEINKDGYKEIFKMKVLLNSDTSNGVLKSLASTISQSSDVLQKMKSNILLVMGDRYEIFAIATAAHILKIPIAHFSGGEITEGAIDDVFRHSISKMSQLHFTSTEIYKKRVIQLGENPKNVFNIGEIGMDNIKNYELFNKEELKKKLGIFFNKINLLITFHPITLETNTSELHIKNLLKALSVQKNTNFIFTFSNADPDNKIINICIKNFVKKNKKKSFAFTTLGRLEYLSLLQYVNGVVGNSSSGIFEAPSFNIATIDIGDRQKGRVKSQSIISCGTDSKSIIRALKKINSKKFKTNLSSKNPYEKKNSINQCLKILDSFLKKNTSLKKQFYDIKF